MKTKKLLWLFFALFVAVCFVGCQKCAHDFQSTGIITQATCTEKGTELFTCTLCGEEKQEPIAKLDHKYDEGKITAEATCTADGVKTFTCTGCNATKTEAVAKIDHQYDAGKITTAATCTADGVKTFTCTGCNATKTEAVAKTGHKYDNGKITTAATCTADGVKTLTCSACNATKTETIAKTGHKYDNGKITTAATCTADGVKTLTCSACNTTKTETIAKLGHSPNGSNICTRCGLDCPIELNMTSSEIAEAKKVKWISERDIDNLDDEQKFRLMFSLKDANENWLKVPVVVAMKITNDNGEIVYKATRIVKTSDYSGWTNGYGKKWTAAAIYIPYADITPGTTSKGVISFEVYNDYVSFNTGTLTISSGLPLKPTTIIMPTLPRTLHEYSYNNRINSSVTITNITYEISGDDLYIYFTGEKTYDKEGNNYSRSCKVGWKLYDSDGYILDSGTFYSPGIAVGEKFRNEKAYAWDVIQPGETYRLEISSVD